MIFRETPTKEPTGKNTSEAVMLSDFNGRILAWSRACEKMFSCAQEEALKKTILHFIHPDYLPKFSLTLDLLRSGKNAAFMISCLDGNGVKKNFELSAQSLKSAEQDLLLLRFRDGFNPEKSECLSKEMSCYADNIPDFIMEWDRFAGITFYNKAVIDFFAEKGAGKVEPYKILPECFENCMRRIISNRCRLCDVEVRAFDHVFSYTFTPFRNDGDRVLVIGRDVTIKKAIEEDIDSAYDRTGDILDFIENVLVEFRFMDLGEEIDFTPVAGLFIRGIDDQASLNPSHVFIALENDEGVIEGYIFSRKHGEVRKVTDLIKLKPEDLKSIVSDRGELTYENWYDKFTDMSQFQQKFPKVFRDCISEIRNFASYRIAGERGGAFISFNYAKDVNRYDAETIKGLAVAVGTLYSMQIQFRERETAQFSVYTKMAEIAEKRDRETAEHLIKMRTYTKILAEEMSKMPKYEKILDRDYLRRLYNAAPLHDIGKVGIPDAILQKPGKLTIEEFQIMRSHTIIGGQILEGPDFLSMARDIAYYHHEKIDGSGYPYRLKNDEIPLSAKIVALADVYDAMTSKRVYKDAISHENTKDVILSSSGTHFHPDVVEAFLRREEDFIRVKQMFI